MNSRGNQYNLVLFSRISVSGNDYLVNRQPSKSPCDLLSLVEYQFLRIVNVELLLKLVLFNHVIDFFI